MSINVQCNCGRTFEVPSFMAGQEVTCSKCGLMLVIPKQDAVPESLDRGATLKRLRCQKCGNTIKITTGRTFKGVQCAACGSMVGLDSPAPPPEPEIVQPKPGQATADAFAEHLGTQMKAKPAEPGEPEAKVEPKPPTTSHHARPPSGPHAVPAPKAELTAFEQREQQETVKEATVKAMAAVPLQSGGLNSQIVDCGSCGKMYAVTESKCPYCFTPRGVGGKTRGERLGSYYNDVLMSFAWGAKGILYLCARYISIVILWFIVTTVIGMFVSKASMGPAIFMTCVVLAGFLGHMYAISFQVIRAGAARQDAFPPLPALLDFRGNTVALLQMLGWILFTMGPSLFFQWLAYKNNGSCLLGGISALLMLAGWPFFTLGYIAIAVHESLLSVSPVGIVKSVIRQPLPVLYLFAMLLVAAAVFTGSIAGVVLLVAGATLATSNVLFAGFLAISLSLPLGSYMMAVFWRMLGIFYYHYEDKVELVRR